MTLAGVTGSIAANIFVPAGGDLQSALNSAHGGDVISLAAGATFTGNFYAPANTSGLFITIQSANMSSLPSSGNRVSASDSRNMPKLVTPNSAPVLQFGNGVNNYKIQGVEMTAAANLYVQDLVQVGYGNEPSTDNMPHNIDFDRCYMHGDPTNGGKRGIAMNGLNITVENSYMSTFFSTWQDTQALAGWNAPGPYQIVNNYLEAGTETVAFGGTVPSIWGMVPSDITVKGNYFFKPWSWCAGSSSFGGVAMRVKNHLELKNAQRVTIDNNTFENNWVGADQRGFALVFTVRTEINAMPWATINTINVTNNHFRHSAAGVNITGHDDNPPGSGSSSGYLFKNNTWEDIGGYGGDGRMFQMLGVSGVTIDHNTFLQQGWLEAFDNGPSTNVNFTNNIALVGGGIVGNGAGVGSAAINGYVNGGTFAGNIIVGANSSQYPGNNFYPGSISNVGFNNFNSGDLNLSSASAFLHSALDGGAIGAYFAPATPAPTQPAQPAAPAIPTGTWVNVVSKNSGKCLDIQGISTAPGTILLQYTCWGGDNQKYQLTQVGSNYKILVKHSGQSLDVAGGPASTGNGAPLIQWPYWGGSNEIFNVQPTSDGFFTISPVNSSKCLDVAFQSKDNGANLIQYTCWGGDNQKWSFVPAQ